MYATKSAMRRIIAGTLLSGGVAVAGFGLSAGVAQADPTCPESPYFCWCPGKPLPKSGTPITWDMGVCHNFRYRTFGVGEQITPPAGFCPPALLSDNWYDRC
jgi:hypothetical protein